MCFDFSNIQNSQYLFSENVLTKFQFRKKRFFSYHLDQNNNLLEAHCLNTGKMRGLLKKDLNTLISKKTSGKLLYRWETIQINNQWIGVNTLVPNYLVSQMLINGLIPQEIFKAEQLFKMYKYRCDFANNNYVIEVKNVHYVEDNIAYFPDCPTERGSRQMDVLMKLAELGKKIIIIYIVQRDDCNAITISKNFDPIYYEKSLKIKNLGIQTLAFNCKVTEKGIFINKQINFFL